MTNTSLIKSLLDSIENLKQQRQSLDRRISELEARVRLLVEEDSRHTDQ